MHYAPQPQQNGHPPFPYPASQTPPQNTFGTQREFEVSAHYGPSVSLVSSAPSLEPELSQASVPSSLVFALNEHAFQQRYRHPTHTLGFPDREVVPYATSPSTQYGSMSPPQHYPYDAEPEAHNEIFYPPGMHGEAMEDDEGLITYGRAEQPSASPYEASSDSTFTPPSFETEAEVGYLYGQMVPLGIAGDNHSSQDEYATQPLASPVEDYAHPVPPEIPPLSIPTEHPPFQTSRSYTLAEAITPIEDHRPRLARSFNSSPDAASLPTASTRSDADASVHVWMPRVEFQDGAPAQGTGASGSGPSPSSSLSGRSHSLAAPRASGGQPAKAKASPSPALSKSALQTEPTGRPGESVIKLAVNLPREPKKKPIMACLFCRERKIACGHPSPTDEDRRCNQCRRRELDCVFPKECRRGQHKRTPRLARVNAFMNGEPLPPGDVIMVQAQSPHVSVSPAPMVSTAVRMSPAGSSRSRQRRRSFSSGPEPHSEGEQRHVENMQRQMAAMHKQRRGGQQ